MTGIELHPALEPLAGLLGTWSGEGHGTYPTIQDFDYGEEVRFTHVGKPFLAYAQRTWSLADRTPLHSETGYWRPQVDGRLEVVLAHPSGILELEEGRLSGNRIELVSTGVITTPSAKEFTKLTRVFELDGDVLTYRLSMAAVGRPLTHHLSARLERDQSP